MAALQVSDELVQVLEQEATRRGLSLEDFLRAMLRHQQTLVARARVEAEQTWWLKQPLSVRAQYEGEYIAIRNQQVIDHDIDERTLTRRIRAAYGNASILIMPAEGPRDIHVYSPRLVQE